MTISHSRRARLFVIGYVGFGLLSTALAIYISRSVLLVGSVIALSIILGFTAIAAGITGRLANWAEPLDSLNDLDAKAVRQLLLQGKPSEEANTRQLLGFLARNFLFGSVLRILLDIEVACVFVLLAVAAREIPPLAIALCAGAAAAILLIILELHQRRKALVAFRMLGPGHQG